MASSVKVAGGGVSTILSKPAATAQPLVARAVDDPRNVSAPTAPARPAPAAPPVSIPTIQSNPTYDQSFQTGLAAARGAIAAQVRNALAETNASEAAGHTEVGTYNPTVEKITSAQRAGLAALASGADRAQHDAGFQSFTPGTETTDPSLSAMNAYSQFQQGATPLLQAGVADRAQARKAAIAQYQLEQNAAMAMQQAQMDQQRQLAQMQIAAQREEAERQFKLSQDNSLRSHQWDIENRDQQHQWDVTSQQTGFNNQKAMAQWQAGQQVNKDTGLTLQHTQDIMGSGAYKRVIQGLNNGTLSPVDVFRYYSAQPDVLSVLADNNPSLAKLYAGAAG